MYTRDKLAQDLQILCDDAHYYVVEPDDFLCMRRCVMNRLYGTLIVDFLSCLSMVWYYAYNEDPLKYCAPRTVDIFGDIRKDYDTDRRIKSKCEDMCGVEYLSFLTYRNELYKIVKARNNGVHTCDWEPDAGKSTKATKAFILYCLMLIRDIIQSDISNDTLFLTADNLAEILEGLG